MNHLPQVFTYGKTQIRTVVQNGEVLFVGKDVCDVLEIKNSRDALGRLDEDEKGVVSIDTPGGKQQMLCVNEAGLYSLILSSRKPEAKQFKRWVTHEVLPTIRKHGAYMTEDVLERSIQDPDFMIGLLTALKDERQKRLAAEQKVEEQKPLVTFAETCMKSEKSLLVREVAKLCTKQGIKIGERQLWQKLRDWGLVFKNRNEPKQEYMNRGYFEVSQGVKENEKGVFTWLTMRVTPKGQMYIIDRLKKEMEVVTR